MQLGHWKRHLTVWLLLEFLMAQSTSFSWHPSSFMPVSVSRSLLSCPTRRNNVVAWQNPVNQELSNQNATTTTTTTTTTSSFRRSRVGPIRSVRATPAAQQQVERRQSAATRQHMAQQDPTLLDTANSTWQGVSSATLRALTELCGVQQRTVVQAATFEAARSGWSLSVRSKTGTGKTLAALVPLVERCCLEPNPRGIPLLVIAPTRELAQQLAATAQDLLTYHHVDSFSSSSSSSSNNRRGQVQVVYGGTHIMGNVKSLERQLPQILVATPGRLAELLEQKVRGRLFKSVLQQSAFHVFWDEADLLLESFAREVKLIVQALPRKRQSLLFSATLPKRRALVQQVVGAEPLVGFQEMDCVTMDFVGTANDTNSDRLAHSRTSQSNQISTLSAVNVNVQEYSYSLPSMEAYLPTLVTMLKQEWNDCPQAKIVVFFPATKLVHFFTRLINHARLLQDSDDGRSSKKRTTATTNSNSVPTILSIHSRMSQSQRQRTSQAFRAADRAILFSSDVSARGLDYPNVTTVIQYGLPSSRELYLHRLGRTARAGHSGKGILVALPAAIESLHDYASPPSKGRGRNRKRPHKRAVSLMRDLKPWNMIDADSQVDFQLQNGQVIQSGKLLDSAEAAYKAFVAYYVGQGRDLPVVLEAAESLARSVGLVDLPELPETILSPK